MGRTQKVQPSFGDNLKDTLVGCFAAAALYTGIAACAGNDAKTSTAFGLAAAATAFLRLPHLNNGGTGRIFSVAPTRR